MTCKFCGQEGKTGARYCNKCKRRFEDAPRVATPEEQFNDHTDPNISPLRIKLAIALRYLLAVLIGAGIGVLLAYMPIVTVALLFALFYRGVVAYTRIPGRGFPKSVVQSSDNADAFFRRHQGVTLTACLVAGGAMPLMQQRIETPAQVAAKTAAMRDDALHQEMNDFPKRIPQIHSDIAAIDALIARHNLAAAIARWKELSGSMQSILQSPLGGYADVKDVQAEIVALKGRIDDAKKQQVSSQDYHMSQYLLGQLDNIDSTMGRGRWQAASRIWAGLHITLQKMRPEVCDNLPGIAGIRQRMDTQKTVIRQALSGHPPAIAQEQKPSRRRTYSSFNQ